MIILNVLFVVILSTVLSNDDEYVVAGFDQPTQEQQQVEEQVQQRMVQDLSLLFNGMYIPTTDVTYQSTIDVDQKEIIDLLNQVTGTNQVQDATYINDAYSIYTQRLRLLSSTDGEIYRMDDTEFFPFFTLYLNYMGDSDYPHDFISSGFNDTATTSGYSGNFKLNVYNLPGGLMEVIQYGTLLLSMVQYIIRNIDVAIQECVACPSDQIGTGTCGMNILDEAVAYYIGSIQSTVSNSYDGYLLYGHAEQLCQFFNTCDGTITVGDDTTSTARSSLFSSRVNMIIIQQFRNIQQSLQGGLCTDAMTYRNIIVHQLFVPMIQGIIRSTYYTEQTIASEYCYADATMYGASILPLIYNCSSTDADLLYDQIKPSNNDNDNSVIRNATLVQEILERNYNCLGISSNDIGIYDPSIMVDYGRCGQPTPAPVVIETPNPRPVSSTTLDSPTITPNTIDRVSNSPTTFIQPVPPTPPTTKNTSGSFDDFSYNISIILFVTMSLIMTLNLIE